MVLKFVWSNAEQLLVRIPNLNPRVKRENILAGNTLLWSKQNFVLGNNTNLFERKEDSFWPKEVLPALPKQIFVSAKTKCYFRRKKKICLGQNKICFGQNE